MTAPALTVFVTGSGSVTGDNLNTFVSSCDILSELRAFVGTVGLQVYCRGQFAPNDGNQGNFFWDPNAIGPDNNLTLIIPPAAASGGWVKLVDAPIGSVPTTHYFSVGSGTYTSPAGLVWLEVIMVGGGGGGGGGNNATVAGNGGITTFGLALSANGGGGGAGGITVTPGPPGGGGSASGGVLNVSGSSGGSSQAQTNATNASGGSGGSSALGGGGVPGIATGNGSAGATNSGSGGGGGGSATGGGASSGGGGGSGGYCYGIIGVPAATYSYAVGAGGAGAAGGSNGGAGGNGAAGSILVIEHY